MNGDTPTPTNPSSDASPMSPGHPAPLGPGVAPLGAVTGAINGPGGDLHVEQTQRSQQGVAGELCLMLLGARIELKITTVRNCDFKKNIH